MTSDTTQSPTPDSLLRERLELLEAQLAALAAYIDDDDRSLDAVATALADLDAAVRSDAADAAALADRIDAARSLATLRLRRVPDGALDGVYEAVRARMAGSDEGLVQAGISRSFLDAPRSLAIWRRTAVAAIALLALGAGLWMRAPATDGEPGTAAAESGDPRDDLLRRLTPVSDAVPDVPANRLFRVGGQPGRPVDARRILDGIRIMPVRELLPVERN